MKIGIIGAGRLGICFALLLERAGYDVLVSDIREDYVNNLNNRQISTNEPNVQEYLDKVKNFKATIDNKEVIQECDIIYTLVATPSLPDGSYDVSSVWEVVNDIKKTSFSNKKTFVIGCTTNPGDCQKFQDELNEYNISVFYNPEFIAQGTIIRDLQKADMVLIGGNDALIYADLCEMYHKIQITEPKINYMSTTSAEIVKLAINCYLTTKISYANMVGEVLIKSGLENEIRHVLKSIGDDSRIGNKFLNYGYGFGGPCLPRDNRSFSAYAKKLGLEYNLGSTTDNFNDEHARFLFDYFCKKNIQNLPFYFDYISYKKGTDIITESQQYRLCLDLLDSGHIVYVSDNESIINQVKEYLISTYNDRIKFGKPLENYFSIEL
jgi:nucleotide sugar dehydrogenase